MVDTSKLFSTMNDISQGAKSVTSTMNRVTSAGSSALKLGDTVGNLMGMTGTGQSVQNAPAGSGQPVQTQTASIIPSGTCIIIPAAYSITGQDRFLGRGAYQSLVNMMNGSGECNNVIIVDANGNPSPNIYDQTAAGLVLKGTQTPVKFNYEDINGVKTPAAVALSETEFQAIAQGMQKQGKDKFKTSDQGEAEDADNRSWWARWWQVVVATATIAIGGLITFLLVKKSRKKEKSAKNENSSLSAQATDLQNQIDDMSKPTDSNTNTNTNSNDSTLASNGTVVTVTDKILNPTPGREY